MTLLRNCLLLGVLITFVQASRISPDPTVFWATSPCDQIPRSMLAIPATAECKMIRWELALLRDPRNQNPTFYKLNYTYGISKPATTDFMNNGTKGTKEGNWTMLKNGQNKTVYRLSPAEVTPAISFVRLDDKLLHLLDSDGKLMIGHGGWSYTLNMK
ncbi:hypothetical protein [Larkinella rosea]|uniref:Copper resistance protein NlpE n=1 Tax=Larkinella rosea TaxID=2025312 RepID=A0A3P1B9N3_9BACT|nr:hypothetical protein [Larkinella rosea]RRA97724.1 hypothetical protein EHT25_32280 [Larkinella rosea]